MTLYPHSFPPHHRSKWLLTMRALSFRDNVVSGLRVWDEVYSRPVYGKCSTFPSDCDWLLRWLVRNNWLEPIKFAPSHSRRAFLGLERACWDVNTFPIDGDIHIGPGSYPVDWDYLVLANIDAYARDYSVTAAVITTTQTSYIRLSPFITVTTLSYGLI